MNDLGKRAYSKGINKNKSFVQNALRNLQISGRIKKRMAEATKK